MDGLSDFEQLPDNVLLQIFSHVEIQEIPLCRSISKHIRYVLSQPDFTFERIRQGTAQELLCIVGGQTPTLLNKSSKYGRKSTYRGIAMNYNTNGIMAYVPSLKSWKQFGNVRTEADSNPCDFLKRVVDYRVIQKNCHTLIFLGGADAIGGDVSNEVWSYTFVSNEWDRLPSMSRRRSSYSFEVIAIEDEIYVFGSDELEDGSDCYCEQFSFETRCWVDICHMPYSFDSWGVTLIQDRYAYIVGVPHEYQQENSKLMIFMAYDVQTDTWSSKYCINTNIVRGRSSSITNHNGEIIIIGGYYDDDDYTRYLSERIEYGDHLDLVYSYDVHDSQWHLKIPRLPRRLRGTATCHYKGHLTVVGGASSFTDDTQGSFNIFCFIEEDNTWSTSIDFLLPYEIVNGYAFTIRA